MEQQPVTTISKFAPEDISMDFERLRQEGIQHLEDLATYIWTDFNVHDPGITIFEVLCYAITDLGYRANLPIEDILAGKDATSSFFSATEILPICPVTQNDYRKFLIDFPGVRNAWVEQMVECGEKLYFLEKDKSLFPLDDNGVSELEKARINVGDKFKSSYDQLIQESITDDIKGRLGAATPPILGLSEFKMLLNDLAVSIQEFLVEEGEGEFKILLSRRKLLTIKGRLFSVQEQINFLIEKLNEAGDAVSISDFSVFVVIQNISLAIANTDLLYFLREKYSTFQNLSIPMLGDDKIEVLREKYQILDAGFQATFNTILNNIKGSLKTDQTVQNLLIPSEDILLTGGSFISGNVEDYYTYLAFLEEIIGSIICEVKAEILNKEAYDKLEDEEKVDYKCINLNGLYQICIDPHQNIDPDSKAAKQLINRIKNGYTDETTGQFYLGLMDVRNLSEDFCSIQITPIEEINLCLEIVIDEDADDKDVMAEVIYRLQNFLTPTIPIQSFQQMLEKGYTCDEIFNGPLLNNGFIEDTDLERTNKPGKIQLSDLYKIILETPKVNLINVLKTKLKEESDFIEDWCIEYNVEDLNCPTKAIIDLVDSNLCVVKQGISEPIEPRDIEEQIGLFKLAARHLIVNQNNGSDIPKGQYRPDLSDYASIQFEFPHNYTIGDNGIPAKASPLKRAQVKQLQAFLLFFDRLLGNYLMQLGKVRELLSVNQDPDMPTYFFNALLDVPGIETLIEEVYEINQAGIDLLEEQLVSQAVLEQLVTAIGDTYVGSRALAIAMGGDPNKSDDEGLLGPNWSVYRKKIEAAFCRTCKNIDEWSTLMASDDSHYLEKVQRLTESKDKQFDRKHRVINHLLARFGEVFTHYATNVFGERRKHLEAKSAFLKDLPALGLEKAKGYNYRAKDIEEGGPDVWDTTNVAGLKKRIYAQMGWGTATTESTLVNPSYILDDEADQSSDLLPMRVLKLYELEEDGKRGTLLMSSSKSYSIRRIKDIKDQLQVYLNDVVEYKLNESGNKVIFSKTLEIQGRMEEVELESVVFSTSDAERFLIKMQELVAATIKGGFHLLEHILLRPNDPADELLQMSYTCDLSQPPVDPYSFWVSVIVPAWKGKFREDEIFRNQFKQIVRRETPAHIALCFRWVESENDMEKLEYAYEQWREALANCTPDECEITETANGLIQLLNNTSCECFCSTPVSNTIKC